MTDAADEIAPDDAHADAPEALLADALRAMDAKLDRIVALLEAAAQPAQPAAAQPATLRLDKLTGLGAPPA